MTETTPPAIDLSHETAIAGWEIAVIGLAVGLAVAFLWRTYFARRAKRKSACAGCAGKDGCSLTQ